MVPVYTERGSSFHRRVVTENDGVVADFGKAEMWKSGSLMVFLTLPAGAVVGAARKKSVLFGDRVAPVDHG